MVKNNNLLETNFEKIKKIAIETNTKKITYSDLKERSIELINFFKEKVLKRPGNFSKITELVRIHILLFCMYFWWLQNLPDKQRFKDDETKKKL